MTILEKIQSKEVNLKRMFNELIKEASKNEKSFDELKNIKNKFHVVENQIQKAEMEMFFNTSKLT